MNETARQRIVVGVSGSRASLSALCWAAAEARLRGAELRVIRAWDPTRQVASYAGAGHAPTPDQEHAAASDELADALRAVFGPVTPAGVTAEVVDGVPERVLLARSAGASLLVLGVTTPANGSGQYEGPVVRVCLMRAQCPVVVVGPDDCAREPGRQLADIAVR